MNISVTVVNMWTEFAGAGHDSKTDVWNTVRIFRFHPHYFFERRLLSSCLLFVFLALQPIVVVFSQPGSEL